MAKRGFMRIIPQKTPSSDVLERAAGKPTGWGRRIEMTVERETVSVMVRRVPSTSTATEPAAGEAPSESSLVHDLLRQLEAGREMD